MGVPVPPRVPSPPRETSRLHVNLAMGRGVPRASGAGLGRCPTHGTPVLAPAAVRTLTCQALTRPTCPHLTYISLIAAVIRKDLLLEVRTRERLVAVAAFSFLAAILFAFALNGTGADHRVLVAPLTWITLIFGGLLAVARTFHLEREDGALLGVLQSPAPRDAIYLGKTIANTLLVLPIAVLTLAAFILLFDVPPPAVGPSLALLGILAVGTLAFVATGTLLAVISVSARAGDALLLVLVFPLVVPVVTFGASASAHLLAGRPVTQAAVAIRWLGAVALVAVFAGSVLFRYLVEE